MFRIKIILADELKKLLCEENDTDNRTVVKHKSQKGVCSLRIANLFLWF